MKKAILGALMALSTLTQAQDLTLPGERWLANADGYICAAYGADVGAPALHSEIDVQFETLKTDRSLDNGLIKATFVEGGSVCSYTALLFADNAASTIKLVDSKAYALDGASDCVVGKEILDGQLEFNDYLYWGRPHRATIMVPSESAEALCGAGSTHIGINFLAEGLIQQ